MMVWVGRNPVRRLEFCTIPWESCISINDEACHGTDNESFLNPGQTAVLGADHPLYAIAKELQWRYPNLLGEDKMVPMMGALPIEVLIVFFFLGWL